MQKNEYYQVMIQRQSILVDKMLDLFLLFASVPRMLLEVFIRKNFGDRYFSAFTATMIFIVLAAVPFRFGYGASFIDVIGKNFTWYLYLAGFLVACIFRGREIYRQPAGLDLERFSLSTGEIHRRFRAIHIDDEAVSIRTIETILEPAFFFLIGAVLMLMSQLLGVLLMAASVLYSLSYIAAYKKGDDFIKDKIDELICSEELHNSFVEGLDKKDTRGFQFYGHRPADRETRRRTAATFVQDEDDVAFAR